MLFYKKTNKFMNESHDSFQTSMKFLLSVGNFFCAIPLNSRAIKENFKHFSDLQFKWLYWRTFVNLFITFLEFLVALLYLYLIICNGFTIIYCTTLTYFGNCFMSFILFLFLTRDWIIIVKEWKYVEHYVNSDTCKFQTFLRRKILTITIIFFILAAMDHLCNVGVQLYITYFHKKEDFFRYLFTVVRNPAVFQVTTYALWKGFTITVLNLIGVFSWTYVDVFIMANSIALTSKFNQITHRIKLYVQKEVDKIYLWKRVREDYSKLCSLTKLMDEKLSFLILLSSWNNFFFILFQCYYSLRNSDDVFGDLNKFYFIFSFAFVIIKMASVYLFAASVNDSSRKALPLLFSVKPHVYNVEVKRIIRFISLDSVCLTGKQFFSIKRSILVDIAVALVTYELVLIQFSK